MSEQLKQELEADTDRLETETVAGSETIGEQEKDTVEGKLESQEGNESKEDDMVPMGKVSLADIISGIPAPTKEEVEAAEAENAKPVKQKAKEKLEAEKKKAAQKNFADPVIDYLMKRCKEDQGLAEDVMQEGKTWNKCFSYIVEQARKQSNGRSTAVEDQVVYEWAEDMKLGAMCFLVVSLEFKEFYRVPWVVFRDMKKIYGHKYMNREELEPYRIKYSNGVVKYLDGIVLRERNEDESTEV